MDLEKQLKIQLAEIRRTRHVSRRRQFRQSKLDVHRSEILKLIELGASFEDVRLWLRRHKRMRITREAIFYRVKIWESAPT